jgi:hypothetical protein
MPRRKAQNPYGSCLAARGRLAARQSRTFPASDPALVRSVALERADRAFSQLLAGTPIGPGGSSDAARVPCCDKARRRRTSSRLTTPHDRAPQWTRWEQFTRGLESGDCAGISYPLSSSRRKPGSRATGSERVALDTGFRRYDGVCCLLRRCQPLSPRGRAESLLRRARPEGERGAFVAAFSKPSDRARSASAERRQSSFPG